MAGGGGVFIADIWPFLFFFTSSNYIARGPSNQNKMMIGILTVFHVYNGKLLIRNLCQLATKVARRIVKSTRRIDGFGIYLTRKPVQDPMNKQSNKSTHNEKREMKTSSNPL